MKKFLFAAVSLLLVPMPMLVAEGEGDWSSFRGGDALSVAADDPRLPEAWSQTNNVVWKVDVPGLAWSSPVVWEDKVFVTTVVSEGEIEEPKKGLYFGGNRMKPSTDVHRWEVHCLSVKDGSTLWKTVVHSGSSRVPASP